MHSSERESVGSPEHRRGVVTEFDVFDDDLQIVLPTLEDSAHAFEPLWCDVASALT